MKFFAPLFFLLLSGLVNAASMTVNVTLPTTNTDGSALAPSAITRLEIDYSTSSTFASNVQTIVILPPAITSPVTNRAITGIAPGTWYARARAANADGLSANSAVASRVVAPAVPMPPVITSITSVAMVLRPSWFGLIRLTEVKGVKLPLGEMCSPLPGLPGFGVVGEYIRRCAVS